MKNILTILSFVLFGCKSPTKKPINNFGKETAIPTKDSVKEYAAHLLSGGGPRTIEDFFLEKRIYDSINSSSAPTRDYYFEVSMFLLKNSAAVVDNSLARNLDLLLNKNTDYLLLALKKYDRKLITDVGVCIGNYYRIFKSDSKLLAKQTSKILQGYLINKELKEIAQSIIKGIGYGMKK